MIKQIKLGELRNNKLLDEIEPKLRKHSLLVGTDSELEEWGSGTLATYKNLKGILTATHVIGDSIYKNKIFSPLLSSNDINTFYVKEIPIKNIITIDSPKGIDFLKSRKKYPKEEGTLDIAFLEIEDSLFEEILNQNRKEPINLYEQELNFNANQEKYWNPNNKHDWCWVLYGFPFEGCEKNNNIIKSKYPTCYLIGGGYKYERDHLKEVKRPFIGEQIDVCEHIRGSTKDLVPESFAGLSGGGTFQIAIADSFEIAEIFFSGIVVSQGAESQILYSRGPISLYEIFTKYLAVVSKEKDTA